MVSSPGLGPIKSQLWAALWTLWLIRFLSVSYMSASPMQNLYQVLLSTYMNCCIFLCLFWCRNSLLLTLAPLTALVICRDIGLIAAVFWVRYKTVPPPVRHTPVNFEFSLLGVAWECLSGGFTGNVHLTVPFFVTCRWPLASFLTPATPQHNWSPPFSARWPTHTQIQTTLPLLILTGLFDLLDRWIQPCSSFWLQLHWLVQSFSIPTVFPCSVYGKPHNIFHTLFVYFRIPILWSSG